MSLHRSPSVSRLAAGLVSAVLASSAHAGSPAIELTLTGTLDFTSDECGTETLLSVPPGTDVRFCYTVANTGDVSFDLHTLADM